MPLMHTLFYILLLKKYTDNNNNVKAITKSFRRFPKWTNGSRTRRRLLLLSRIITMVQKRQEAAPKGSSSGCKIMKRLLPWAIDTAHLILSRMLVGWTIISPLEQALWVVVVGLSFEAKAEKQVLRGCLLRPRGQQTPPDIYGRAATTFTFYLPFPWDCFVASIVRTWNFLYTYI